MKIAVIPARGGSRRIPRKNVRQFRGLPMIAWTIRAARASGCFDRIVASTDDEEIAAAAADHGAEVPFRRPAELAGDHVGILPVMAHAVRALAEDREQPQWACCLFAAAPLMRAQDIRAGLERIESGDLDYVFSAARFPAPIQRAFRIDADGRCTMFDPAQFHVRSQDLEPAYHDAGQFYWGASRAWLEERPVFTRRSAPLILPAERAIDIDEPEDWTRAEMAAEWLEARR